MSVAIGPSGKNDFYLNSLDAFLSEAHTIAAEKDDTNSLAAMAKKFQTEYQPFSLFGCGSNQHNQLLLDRPNNAANLHGDDAHEKKEILICTNRRDNIIDKPKEIYAGGGHSGLLTTSGKLYMWGWNETGQCATVDCAPNDDDSSSFPIVLPLSNLNVEKAALGFSHTLVIEKGSHRLYAFGSNERGQVNGTPSNKEPAPITPEFLKSEEIKGIAAGLFHSAVVTMDGELVCFGCSRFGQSLSARNEKGDAWIDRWKPDDGSRVVDVVCGRRHSLVLDDRNRIWSFGENNYGQLGRKFNQKFDRTPTLVEGCDDFQKGSVVRLACGWSHNLVHVESEDGSSYVLGWGRNDKGQLGIGTVESVPTPRRIFVDKELQSVACSSESTIVLDKEGRLFGCGWNEHGNLATGDISDKLELHAMMGEKVVGPPGLENPTIMIAAGGAHILASMVEN
jgi:alpha-tubulin suppressor-like RCC1 family protein